MKSLRPLLIMITLLLVMRLSSFAQIDDEVRRVLFGKHIYYSEVNHAGTQAAVVTANNVYIVDLNSGEKVLDIGADYTGTAYWGASFDPTDTRILVRSVGAGIMRNVTTGDSLGALETMDGESILFGRYGCFNNDGSRVYIGCGDGVIRGWNAATGELVQRLVDSTVQFYTVMMHPSEQKLLSATNNGKVTVWDLLTGDTVRTFRHPEPKGVEIARARYSTDGSMIAISLLRDSLVTLWEASTGQRVATLGGHSKFVSGLAFHPDGRLLFTNGQDGETNVWDLSSDSLLQSRSTGIVYDLYITRDGRMMLGGSNTVLYIGTLTTTSGVPADNSPLPGTFMNIY